MTCMHHRGVLLRDLGVPCIDSLSKLPTLPNAQRTALAPITPRRLNIMQMKSALGEHWASLSISKLVPRAHVGSELPEPTS
jgi:hypothetical protein